MKSKFIVFEGPDGSGKSSMARMAELLLTSLGYAVQSVKEPGNLDAEFCQDIRQMIFNKPYSKQLDAIEQGLLFFVDHYTNARFVKLSLEQVNVVISDRWLYSQYAYDSVKKASQVDALNLYRLYETEQVQPDLVIQMDADPEVIMARLAARMGKDVSQEQKKALWGDKPDIQVHTELRQSYRNQAKRYQHAYSMGGPVEWVTINQHPDDSAEEVFHYGVEPVLKNLMENQ